MRSSLARTVLAAALSAPLLAGIAGTASAAPAQSGTQAHKLDSKPPYTYASCLQAVKEQRKETGSQARWHCDQLVKKGWVAPPVR
ncbi:hypothetical protein [Streptomyces sp. NPDC050264]|uniref:hypothetical protein n=1 Tax=Streptomyces sp. NPDC050264 TaxID=3155038 RepID=UPI003447E0D7